MISVSELYNHLVYYYNNPVFTKIKNTGDYSIYMCKLNVHLANKYRYLVCMVQRDVFFVGETQPLSDIRWQIFQTRSLTDSHPIIKKRHSYHPKSNDILNSSIHQISKNNQETKYTSANIPVEISLLSDSNNLYEYPSTGTVKAALETYNTVIVIK